LCSGYGIEIEYVDTGDLKAVESGDAAEYEAGAHRDADQSADDH
jgi:hypothetical protein